MAEFVHEPDFSTYSEGALFTEYATKGGNPPGNIVTDTDGKKSLLFGIASVWMTYLHEFKPLDKGGAITCEPEIRIETPDVGDVEAFADMYAFDGDRVVSGYVRVMIQKGKLIVAGWNDDQEYIYGRNPLVFVKGGTVDTEPHYLTVTITGSNISLTLDGVEKIGPLTKPKPNIDSFRVRAVGLVTSTNPSTTVGRTVRGTYKTRSWISLWLLKTVTVYQYWLMLIRKYKVSGEKK
jgi:hypothetical protein